jgi:hypothetical protein
VHHLEKWQNEAIDAIKTYDWKPKSKKSIEAFSKLVDNMVLSENSSVFRRDIFDRLKFPAIDDRLQSISATDTGTFEWVFASPSQDSQHQENGNFTEWLSSTKRPHLFWVAGEHYGVRTLVLLMIVQAKPDLGRVP